MGQWTHINASIRFDFLPGDPHSLPIPEDLGEMYKYGEPKKDSIIPHGHEGTLIYKIIVNNPRKTNAMTVVFFGDLGDYNDLDEIVFYFARITTNRHVLSGILEIEIDNEWIYSFRFNKELQQWECIHQTTI
jgi:hypothetical protein